MRNILVTGGAGFIGSNLCYSLLGNPSNVVYCLDNLSCSSGDNIKPFLKHKNFRFIHGDVCDPSFSLPALDLLYHFACPASPVWYSRDPVKTMLTSVVGTKNMLDLANKLGARMLFTSTSEVYGDPEVHPQPETYNGNVSITGPRACYDEGKRAAETLCADYQRMTNVDVRVVRLFNTYGPNMAYNDGRVVSNFITQALDGLPMTIYGSGNQTRSFCYIQDMLDMLLLVMSDKTNYGPVNLGNPKEYTIRQIAEQVAVLTGTEHNIVFKDLPQDDPKIRQPDLSKLRRMVNLSDDYTSLEDGLRATVNYFRTAPRQ